MIASLLLAAVAAGGVTVSPLTVPAPKDPLNNPLVLEGRELIRGKCIGCHNVQPRGLSINAFAPPFRRMRYLTPEVLRAVAAHPRVGPPHGMPPVILTPSEAGAVSAYIRAYANADRRTRIRLGLVPCFARSC